MTKTHQPQKPSRARRVVLLFAALTSPLTCCACMFLLDALPASWLPSGLSFMLNVFESEARVENRSRETLYLTPFTTSSGRPVVIKQLASIRQRDIPLQPSQALALTYDAADAPLSGIAVCRSSSDCRLMAANAAKIYRLDVFEDLPPLRPDWLATLQAQASYSFEIVLVPLLGLVPVLFLGGWLYLGRRESGGIQQNSHRRDMSL